MIYAAWLPWVIPLVGAGLVPLVGAVSARFRGWFAVAVAGLGMAAALYGAWTYAAPSSEGFTVWFSMSVGTDLPK
jgi:hypothetical protein